MPTCNRCKSTSVVWGKTKAGKPMLYEASTPHFIYCSARPKASKDDKEMLAALTTKFDSKRAKQLLPHAKGDTFEAKFLAALAYADTESARRKES